MARRRWTDLSRRTRHLILGAAAVEGALKVAALVDLARRPADLVRGSKLKWAGAILLINSSGAAPITYFARGRRRR